MKKFFRILLFLVVVVVIGYFAKSYLGKSDSEATSKSVFKFQSVKASKGEIVTQIDITGVVEPETTVEIKSKVSGKIVKFYKDINDSVRIGDLIATIEPDYQQANSITNTRSNLDLARIRYEWALKDFKDIETQYNLGHESKYNYDQSKKELDQALINFNIAKEQYAQVEEIDTKGAESKIYASVHGKVISRSVEEGEMISSVGLGNSDGTAIMNIADLSKMIVKSNINEIDINKYREGQKAQITVPANPYHKYKGTIKQIAVMAIDSNNTKVFPIEIELEDVDKKIMPGMTAEITIQGDSKQDIIKIPIRALFSNDKGEDVVYIAENEKITETRVVQTGINNFREVEIVSGLQENEEISLFPPSMINGTSEKK